MSGNRVKSVLLSKVEGRAEACYHNKTFDSIEAANVQMRRDERPDLGYYKYDFKVIFDTGLEYKGRIELEADIMKVPDIREHIFEHLTYHIPEQTNKQGIAWGCQAIEILEMLGYSDDQIFLSVTRAHPDAMGWGEVHIRRIRESKKAVEAYLNSGLDNAGGSK